MSRPLRRLFSLATLAIAIDGDAPPSEFRLFKAGWNQTTQGKFLFDEQAAEATMAQYAAHRVDRMIDLEHLSLDDTSPNFDPDARGWCKLELRDGELWASDVSWTADGTRRLTEKTQRYVSPTFRFDKKSMRITRVVNIALTALPATHGTEELVAASDRQQQLSIGGSMNAKLLKDALDAIEAGDANKALEILKGLIASAAGADGGDPAADPNAESPPAPLSEDAAAAIAATERLMKLTNKSNPTEAVTEAESYQESHLALLAERAKLAEREKALDATERRKLVGNLVKLGIEYPVTAWSDQQGTVPVKRLQDEPIAELRARVAVYVAARGGKLPGDPPKPPGDEGTTALSERELKMCRDKKIDPAKYAETRAKIRARSQHSQQQTE